MAHWKLRIDKQFADEIFLGNKTFEVRKEDDKVFQRGDTVEFDVNRQNQYIPEAHPISGKVYEITYVLHGWGIEEGTCAFSIKEQDIEDPEEMQKTMLQDIHKMCSERPNCAGCIFKKRSDDSVFVCMLRDIPRDWRV